MKRPSSVSGAFFILAGVSVGSVAAILALGFWPTAALAGPRGIDAMLAGCGVSLAASFAGAIPVAAAWTGKYAKPATAILASTAVRMLVAMFLALTLIVAGWFERTVLALWIGLSYLLMLAVDTLVALKLNKRAYVKD